MWGWLSLSLKFTVPALEGGSHGGKTIGYIYSGATPIGVFSLSDACRSGVVEAIGHLKSLGIKTAMLTGDSHAAAMQAQEQVGKNNFLPTNFYCFI